ncbi:MAG: LysR family transcriptional regulator [Actinomycetota bacterium]|nr:LysR family transcriptional regulator [Actinomycetota bacterium]
MHLDLVCVESFLILSEEAHYGRAAARLHITSSTLTKRVQRLERQLKVRLLERGPCGVLALTPAGTRLGTDAGPLLEHERAAREAVRTRAVPAVLA